MLKNDEINKAFDACTPFLTIVDRAIVEAEANLAYLRGIRGVVKRDLLGENPNGMAAVLNNAGPPLSEPQAPAGFPSNIDAELEMALEDELAKESSAYA